MLVHTIGGLIFLVLWKYLNMMVYTMENKVCIIIY